MMRFAILDIHGIQHVLHYDLPASTFVIMSHSSLSTASHQAFKPAHGVISFPRSFVGFGVRAVDLTQTLVDSVSRLDVVPGKSTCYELLFRVRKMLLGQL